MGYHKEKKLVEVEMEVIPKITCDRCYQEIQRWPEDDDRWPTPVGALTVSFSGGYGMYIDEDNTLEMLLCKGCADDLFENFPSLKRCLPNYG